MRKLDAQLQNPDLFISDALIDGKWVKKDNQFDVYGSYYDPVRT